MVFGRPARAGAGGHRPPDAFGLPFPFSVAITNQEYGFKSGIKYTFPPPGLSPSAIDDAIKHGLGVMLELELVAGFGKESESVGDSRQLSAEMPVTRS